MRTYKFSVILVLLLACFLLIFSACSNSSDDSERSQSELLKDIYIGYQEVTSPEILAKASGYFEEEFPDSEITLHWIKYDAGPDVNEAIINEVIDIGEIGSAPAAEAILNNYPYQIFYIQFISDKNEALVVKNDSGINENNIKKQIEDKTIKIGVTYGSTAHFGLGSFLESKGLKLKDIDNVESVIKDLSPNEIVEKEKSEDNKISGQWRFDSINGGIDGAFIWQPKLGILKKLGGQDIITVGEIKNPNFISADLSIVRNDFLEKHPELVKKYVRALDKAVKYYQDPETKSEAVKILSEQLDLSEENVKLTKWLNAQEQEKEMKTMWKKLRATAEFLKQNVSKSVSPDLEAKEDYYDKAIYRKAVEEVGKENKENSN
ncbi:MAG: ABC transporter substrate-binding protein [Crocosphaera sp.]|nr:ABC transporter substrate-binding protein [Crocosphaera sp.]